MFTTGWILRCISSFSTSNLNLYIAQTVFILAGPPIYAAAEYNILGRLMHYVPMHAPLHPGRVLYFFIYVGAAVESLTAAGASMIATNSKDPTSSSFRTGGTLISISLVLQAAVECLFMTLVALIHYRSVRARMFTPNIRNLCIMLYGTSTLILFRCIFRAIESFSTQTSDDSCAGICRAAVYQEWYLYVFEAVPMVVYTYWLNIVHPGRLLPSQSNRYLDPDGRTERIGPGWIDRRSQLETFIDLFDLVGVLKGQPHHEKFWLSSRNWPAVEDGSFSQGTAFNVRSKQLDTPSKIEEAVHPK